MNDKTLLNKTHNNEYEIIHYHISVGKRRLSYLFSRSYDPYSKIGQTVAWVHSCPCNHC